MLAYEGIIGDFRFALLEFMSDNKELIQTDKTLWNLLKDEGNINNAEFETLTAKTLSLFDWDKLSVDKKTKDAIA